MIKTYKDNRNLPSQQLAFAEFLSSYPSYAHTTIIDKIRHEEYAHLDALAHVCFDYTGVGLFTSSQTAPEIGLTFISANLATHAMYAEEGSTESFFRKRILYHLNLDEDNYYIVFTANSFSAFKLLGESYPFHEAPNLLLAYDHQYDSVQAIRNCARSRGAKVSVALLSPSGHNVESEDVRKKLQRKRSGQHKTGAVKGLFVNPSMSQVTGCKNPRQWVTDAQQNGWHVLLEVTDADSKVLDVYPEFVICSFYYVFGQGPTGFACLAVRKSVLTTLGDSSRARAVGMVKIVRKHLAPSGSLSNQMPLKSTLTGIHSRSGMQGTGRFSFQMHELSERPNFLLTHGGFEYSGVSFCASKIGNRKAPTSSSHMNHTYWPSSSFLHTVENSEGGTESRLSSPSHVEFSECPCLNTTEIVGSGCEAPRGGTKMRTRHQRNVNNMFDGQNISISLSDLASSSPMTESTMLPNLACLDGDLHQEKSLSANEKTSEELKWTTVKKESGMSLLDPCSPSRCYDKGTLGIDNQMTVVPRSLVIETEIMCNGLDHVEMLRPKKISIRLGSLANWFIFSLMRLKHPNHEDCELVHIYCSMSQTNRGSTVAFTLSDAQGNTLDPKRVQTLADRSNISLSIGFIKGPPLTETSGHDNGCEVDALLSCMELAPYRWWTKEYGMPIFQAPVLYATIGFLNNFSDVYRLWVFIAQFLDPDFVNHELWRYQAFNQETIEI